MILVTSGFLYIIISLYAPSDISHLQVPDKHAVCIQTHSIKKGIHVCAVLCVVAVYNTTFNNAYLHPTWQQTPVWKKPQGGGCTVDL